MTTAEPLTYYPQYCFHLSPTINKWCPLRAADIVGLTRQPGFEDVGVFFYLNHPIQWVRITGVVVAVDDYYGHRVYTIDDSTGQCIECALPAPKPVGHDHDSRQSKSTDPEADSAKTVTKAATKIHIAETRTTDNASAAPVPADIDVGMVVDIKGAVKLFRGQKQINIRKAVPVLSTNQEVLFWDKVRDFRRDILAQPWVLKDREVRRCRKLQHAEAINSEATRGKKAAERPAEKPGEGNERSLRRAHVLGDRDRQTQRNNANDASVKPSRAQRAARTEILGSRASKRDTYDALGL
ncbi:hypothetical protein F4777DRAFT_446729 [Nemania sp. FL0916]|nr:hypothetical protein F4777DRAFT_446729 [Nemania sp. FL0916]